VHAHPSISSRYMKHTAPCALQVGCTEFHDHTAPCKSQLGRTGFHDHTALNTHNWDAQDYINHTAPCAPQVGRTGFHDHTAPCASTHKHTHTHTQTHTHTHTCAYTKRHSNHVLQDQGSRMRQPKPCVSHTQDEQRMAMKTARPQPLRKGR